MPTPVADALDEWLRVHDQLAPGTIEGLYLVGSVALDDWTPHSDIDVIAVIADPSDPDVFDDLAAAQAAITSSISIDGPYVAWGDLVVPPMAVQRPWVLDGEYHVDGESFEINPVTWYTLASRGITLRGERPDRIGVFVDETERRLFVRENLQTYWRGVGERLAAGVEATPVTVRCKPPGLMRWQPWYDVPPRQMQFTIAIGDPLAIAARAENASVIPAAN